MANFLGWIVYKDRDGRMIPLAKRGKVLLFISYEAAQDGRGWLDVVAPVDEEGLQIARKVLKNA